ncbi:hypothetical protein HC251_12665 [Iamia sp. SCSIO 61187]|uniref:hypothetical protein n=1 Tax=Iamia sp. SCSIO 61187 TaxID=2722752 RepID=UPI001C63510E|nr:hypothetical protein [Iamia sp. SCSIO 61187]QYG93198.1 hypothetical protein HC251_12665 [Iamia sp. SCSIO 61187]
MALARTPRPTDDDVVGPLIRSHPSTPVVTVAMATKPAAHLRSGDRRRLARHVSGAERRLARAVPPSPARARVVRQLWTLADRVARAPAREGVALVAGSDDGRTVVLHHAVTDRVIVGPAPTYEGIIEATWGFGRLAILRLTAGGARLICSDGATLWEPRPPWDPLGLQLHIGLARADLLVRAALPGRTPLVVAGDDRIVRAFLDRGHRGPVVGTLAGDHSETSAATLAALAQRTLRRALDDRQRSAMVSLALAVNRGTAVRGLAPVRAATPGAHHVLLVEDGARPQVATGPDRPLTDRLARAGGSVVVVPDGFLAHHGRAALAPDHRTLPSAPSPSERSSDADVGGDADRRILEAVR